MTRQRPDSKSQERGGVRVLHKTLDILEALKDGAGRVRLADLARDVDLPKATAYRILTTLETRGYLDRSERGGYLMAKKFFELRRDAPLEDVLRDAAQPVMKRLADATRETVNLGILDAGEVVVISTVESPQALRMCSKVGNRRYVHATALGKVLLAGMADSDVMRLIARKRLPRLTSNTIVTRSALLTEVDRVRERGFAIDNQENEMGGRCIGAPIHGPEGGVVAALSVSGPVLRMDLARAHALAVTLTQTCSSISKAIRD